MDGYDIMAGFDEEPGELYPLASLDYLAEILDTEAIKVLVLNGDLDYMINFNGTETVLNDFNWKHREDYQNR